jgi:hypothetical protein
MSSRRIGSAVEGMNDDDTGSQKEPDSEANRWVDWRNHGGDA